MAFRVKNVGWNEAKQKLSKLRHRVFVYEWRIPVSCEFDGLDDEAHHVLLVDDQDNEVATGRLTADGELGRIAVIPRHRGPNVYKQLFNALLKIAKQNAMQKVVVQCDLEGVDYYQRHGFRPVGKVYMDAGVPRQKMECDLEQFNLSRVDLTH